jgi:signal transduction histidine kinase
MRSSAAAFDPNRLDFKRLSCASMISQNHPLSQRNVPRTLTPDVSLQTLVSIQKQLFHCPDISTAYQKTLESLQAIPQVSRVAIVEACRPGFSELSTCWDAEWWAGSPPFRRKRRAGKVSSIFHALSSGWVETLAQGKPIVGTLNSLPPLERELLHRQGIAAILIVPLMVDRQLYGAIRFENFQHPRNWTAPEVALLEGVAIALSLKLEQLIAAAEQSRTEQLQADCVATVAHELRSPLAHIQMLAHLLEISLQQESVSSSPVAHHLKMLQDECQHKNSMINNLLDLSRLSSAPDPIDPIDIPLQVWVPYLTETFQSRFTQQQQHLKIDIPASLPPLRTDSCTLERILTELLHNAWKYTPAQGTIALSAQPCSNDPGGHLCLTITNTGVEISPTDLPHIFDRFYRIPSLDIWAQGGTGLGLPLVKKMVEQLGATIQVSSTDQQVKLTLRFPLMPLSRTPL